VRPAAWRVRAAAARLTRGARAVLEHQSGLIAALRARKALAREWDGTRIEGLALRTAQMRLLACNLGERLGLHEGARVQSSLQVLQGEVAALDRQLERLERQLEEMMLPAVSIGEAFGARPASERERERAHRELQVSCPPVPVRARATGAAADARAGRSGGEGVLLPPPPPFVLSGHAASLTPY